MNEPIELIINQEQLNSLLSEEQRENFDYILKHNVFCGKCGGIAKLGIKVNQIILDSINDLRVEGICKKCNSNVARILEFGDNKDFIQKALNLKKNYCQTCKFYF
jgi:hypothetical protein